eukprot:1146952-Pelagomonas_calceolata.AAC.4
MLHGLVPCPPLCPLSSLDNLAPAVHICPFLATAGARCISTRPSLSQRHVSHACISTNSSTLMLPTCSTCTAMPLFVFAFECACMHSAACVTLVAGACCAHSAACVTHCLLLVGVAVPLVNAFAIPDHILRAPIGLAGSGVSDMYKEYLLAAGFDV